MSSPDLVIIGSLGMLGSEVVAAARARGADVLDFPDADALDITDEKDVRRQLNASRPSLVINAAGYTDVDGAEVNMVPKHMVNLGADLSLPDDLTASVTVQVVGPINESISNNSPNEIDGHVVVNAKVQKLLVTDQDYEVSVYLEPYNILNDDFEMPWGFQDPGFSVNGGVTVSF